MSGLKPRPPEMQISDCIQNIPRNQDATRVWDSGLSRRMPDCEARGPRHQVCPLSQAFSSTRGETYWTVTFTTVDTVVVPDVPVTVIAAAPFGVPGEPELEVDVYALQPTITNASANIARHMLNAKCRRGACRNLTRPATRNAESMADSSRSPSGPGPLRG